MQVSRNLFQYFSADQEIVDTTDGASAEHGNIISIAKGEEFPSSADDSVFPIQIIKGRGVCVRSPGGPETVFEFQEDLGAIYLRPVVGGRLELVLWGFADYGLRLAARLMPMLTGVGQPEFVIVSKRCAWEGAGGVLAMGSFDHDWNISEASFIT